MVHLLAYVDGCWLSLVVVSLWKLKDRRVAGRRVAGRRVTRRSCFDSLDSFERTLKKILGAP